VFLIEHLVLKEAVVVVVAVGGVGVVVVEVLLLLLLSIISIFPDWCSKTLVLKPK
jgi:tRNA A37 threonylcarbamoyladenosine dehydratase